MEDKSLKNIKIAETQRATYEKRRKQCKSQSQNAVLWQTQNVVF